MKVGEAIRKLREAKGYTLERLAESAHTSLSNLCNLELGRSGYSPARIEYIAAALGVRVSEIFRLAEDLEGLPTPEPMIYNRDEKIILDNYRNMCEEQRVAYKMVGDALAQQTLKKAR